MRSKLLMPLLEQAKKGCVIAYKFKGKRFDCGSFDGYIEATNYCYQKVYFKGSKAQIDQTATEKIVL